MHTTVNMGVRLLKPKCKSATTGRKCMHDRIRTSDRKFWAAGDELKKVPAFFKSHLTHSLQQVANTLTVQVVAMIGLDGVHKC